MTAVGSVPETIIEVGSDGNDGSPDDDRLVLETLVQSGNEVADLSVRVIAEHAFVLPSQPTSFQIIVENVGPNAAAWPSVQFSAPAASHNNPPTIPLRPVPALAGQLPTIPAGWTCDTMISPPIFPSLPTGFRCLAISQPVGASVFSFAGKVMPAGVISYEITGPITLDATIASVSTDPVGANNAGGVSVSLGAPPATAIPSTSTTALWVLLSLMAVAGVGGLLLRRNA